MQIMKKMRSLIIVIAVCLVTMGPSANAGPLVCLGTSTGAALGWLGYGVFKTVTAPFTIWTTPLEVAALSAAGTATIELVVISCAAPTP